uniref:FBD domain-containing protein n=1 Tax=Leersia perrieri TaxID=77586 RepID=A0A0D9X015_9ORYZ
MTTGSEQLLEMCPVADKLYVSIKISDGTNQSMVLYLHMVGILRFIHCPITPIFSAFLRRCPNLTRLYIDLSMLHQFSELHPNELILPVENNDATTQQQGHADHPCEIAPRDQLQLALLRDIRLNGFVGTDGEMELANLLFGAGAPRPVLQRISITSFPELRGGAHGIAAKMTAQLPLLGGHWEVCSRNLELTWTRTTTRC